MNPEEFAKRIREDHPALEVCTVLVQDSDGELVIDVIEGDSFEKDGDLKARYDTGLPGDFDPSSTEYLAEKLCHELCRVGISASFM